MFTGIIEEQGRIVSIEFLAGDAARVTIEAELVTSDATHGCSIAVDGTCLTVVELGESRFSADVMRETLRCTTIGDRAPGDRVNLERAMRADGRLGGHIVSGHVDGLASLVSRSPSTHWDVLRFKLAAELSRYVATKGSITVDGVSLTVAAVGSEADGSHWVEVSLIPETLAATTLGTRRVGDQVNIETDVLAKYVERLLDRSAQ